MLTCSECNREFKNDTALKAHIGRVHYISITNTCKICNKKFKSSGRKPKRIYCSEACKYKSFKLRYKGAANPSYKGGKIKKKCLFCEKLFEADRSSAKRYAKYCSLSCSSKGMWQDKKDRRRIGFKGTKFRTELEYAYAVWLDSYELTWFYEPKTFTVNNSPYTPDFYIKEWNMFVDVPRKITNKIKSKIDGFKEEYPNHEIKIMSPEELNQIIKGEIENA